MSERKTKDAIAILMTSRNNEISIALSVSVLFLPIIQWDIFKRDYINLIGIDLLIPNTYLNLRLNNPLQICAFKQGLSEVIMWTYR